MDDSAAATLFFVQNGRAQVREDSCEAVGHLLSAQQIWAMIRNVCMWRLTEPGARLPDDAQSGTLLCGATEQQDLLPTMVCLPPQVWCPGLRSTSETNRSSPDAVGEVAAGSLVVHWGSNSVSVQEQELKLLSPSFHSSVHPTRFCCLTAPHKGKTSYLFSFLQWYYLKITKMIFFYQIFKSVNIDRTNKNCKILLSFLLIYTLVEKVICHRNAEVSHSSYYCNIGVLYSPLYNLHDLCFILSLDVLWTPHILILKPKQ